MSISSSWDLASDAELITAVRSGETAAFGVLYERHASAARAVAAQYSNSAADADDAVSDAFHRVFSTIQGGAGPDVAFRAYLFTVVRRVAMGRVQSDRRVQTTDDLETFEAAFGPGETTEDPTFAGFERGVVSRAYKSLPERWQAVLWYTEVERLSPAEIAPVLGLTANGVAALAYRAREGLRQAYLQQHLASPTSEACTIVNGKLGAYVRGGLAKRETALVESHLDECGECRALVLELGDVNHGMRAIIAPLVLGGIAVSVLQGVGFGGAAGTLAAAGLGAGGAGAGGAGASGTGVGTGGGVSVGAGSAGAGAGGGAVGAGATTGAGALAGVGAASTVGASALAAGGVASLSAALDAQPAAATTGAGSTGAGASGAGASGAGAAGAGAAGAAGAGGAAAASGGLAALVASVPVTAIGLAAAGVIVAGAVGVAGAMGAFSGDDEGPTVVADDPDLDGLPTPGDEPSSEPSDEPTDAPSSPSDDPTNPANVPDVGDPADDPRSSPAPTSPGDPTPTTPPTSPPPTSPPPTSPPPTTPPPTPTDPPVLVADPPDLTLASFVAGAPTRVSVPVSNTGGDAGEIVTQFLFPEGTDVSVTAADPPTGGLGTVVPKASNGWSCSTVGAVATCTLPALGSGDSSTLFADVTVLDDELDGERSMRVGVRTWAPDLGGAPEPHSVRMKVQSPPTSFAVDRIAATRLVGTNDGTATASATVHLSNSGTSDAPFVRLSNIPVGVSVTPNGGWTCVVGIGLECTGPKVARGASTDLVLTFADSGPLVDVAWTGSVKVDVDKGNDQSFPLTTLSAPARYEVASEQRGRARTSLDLNLAVANTGRTTGTAVEVAVDLPDGMTWADAQWTACTSGAGDICHTVPSLAPGAEVTRSLKLVAPAGQVPAGAHPITFTMTDARGTTSSSTATVQVGVVPPRVDITAPAQLVLQPKVAKDITATVTNTEGSTATGVAVRADLPAGVTWTSAGSCSTVSGSQGANQTVECFVGNLAVGQSAAVTLTVTTNGNGPNGKEIRFEAVWDGEDGDVVSAPVTTGVVVGSGAEVAVTLDAQTTFQQGVPRDLVVTVTNTGSAAATGLTATFQLPAETSWVRTANGSVWTCTASGQGARTVTCTTSSLAAGATVELAGSIRANAAADGRVIALGLTWNGGAAQTAQTTVVIGTLPACAPAWQYRLLPPYYRTGDVVSFQSWNYERRVDNLPSIYEPNRIDWAWQSLGACA